MKNHKSDKESLTELKDSDDGSLDSNKMHFPKDMKLDDEVRLDLNKKDNMIEMLQGKVQDLTEKKDEI